MHRHGVVMTAGSCGIAALAMAIAPITARAAQATHTPQAAHATHKAPGWRIVHVNNYGDHDFLAAVVAVSQRDAWAGGLVSKVATQAFLQHWNGQAWTRVALPAAIGKISNAQVSGLAASAATNVWAFISGQPAAVVHFNGTGWQVMREWPGQGFAISGATFGPRDVWMFGGTGPQTVGTWHYNGHRWSQPKMPLTAIGISRISARDEWAIGERRTGRGEYAGGVERWRNYRRHRDAQHRARADLRQLPPQRVGHRHDVHRRLPPPALLHPALERPEVAPVHRPGRRQRRSGHHRQRPRSSRFPACQTG
jgi:hypothetical protein